MPLGKPARAQIMKWQKAGTAGLCEIKETNVGGEEGKYLLAFPYKGKKVDLVINFAIGFPAKVPAMYFTTKMWHTGVDEKSGAICVAAITPWDTQTGPQKLVEHVVKILAQPETCVDSKVNAAACTEFTANKGAYEEKAKSYVDQHGHA